MSEQQKENLILQLTFEFAVQCIEYCDRLMENKKFVIGQQLLKSATSIGTNTKGSTC